MINKAFLVLLNFPTSLQSEGLVLCCPSSSNDSNSLMAPAGTTSLVGVTTAWLRGGGEENPRLKSQESKEGGKWFWACMKHVGSTLRQIGVLRQKDL